MVDTFVNSCWNWIKVFHCHLRLLDCHWNVEDACFKVNCNWCCCKVDCKIKVQAKCVNQLVKVDVAKVHTAVFAWCKIADCKCNESLECLLCDCESNVILDYSKDDFKCFCTCWWIIAWCFCFAFTAKDWAKCINKHLCNVCICDQNVIFWQNAHVNIDISATEVDAEDCAISCCIVNTNYLNHQFHIVGIAEWDVSCNVKLCFNDDVIFNFNACCKSKVCDECWNQIIDGQWAVFVCLCAKDFNLNVNWCFNCKLWKVLQIIESKILVSSNICIDCFVCNLILVWETNDEIGEWYTNSERINCCWEVDLECVQINLNIALVGIEFYELITKVHIGSNKCQDSWDKCACKADCKAFWAEADACKCLAKEFWNCAKKFCDTFTFGAVCCFCCCFCFAVVIASASHILEKCAKTKVFNHDVDVLHRTNVCIYIQIIAEECDAQDSCIGIVLDLFVDTVIEVDCDVRIWNNIVDVCKICGVEAEHCCDSNAEILFNCCVDVKCENKLFKESAKFCIFAKNCWNPLSNRPWLVINCCFKVNCKVQFNINLIKIDLECATFIKCNEVDECVVILVTVKDKVFFCIFCCLSIRNDIDDFFCNLDIRCIDLDFCACFNLLVCACQWNIDKSLINCICPVDFNCCIDVCDFDAHKIPQQFNNALCDFKSCILIGQSECQCKCNAKLATVKEIISVSRCHSFWVVGIDCNATIFTEDKTKDHFHKVKFDCNLLNAKFWCIKEEFAFYVVDANHKSFNRVLAFNNFDEDLWFVAVCIDCICAQEPINDRFKVKRCLDVEVITQVNGFFKDDFCADAKINAICIDCCLSFNFHTQEEVWCTEEIHKFNVCGDIKVCICGDAVDAHLQVANADCKINIVVDTEIYVNAKLCELDSVHKWNTDFAINVCIKDWWVNSCCCKLVVCICCIKCTCCMDDCTVFVFDEYCFCKCTCFIKCKFFFCQCKIAFFLCWDVNKAKDYIHNAFCKSNLEFCDRIWWCDAHIANECCNKCDDLVDCIIGDCAFFTFCGYSFAVATKDSQFFNEILCGDWDIKATDNAVCCMYIQNAIVEPYVNCCFLATLFLEWDVDLWVKETHDVKCAVLEELAKVDVCFKVEHCAHFNVFSKLYECLNKDILCACKFKVGQFALECHNVQFYWKTNINAIQCTEECVNWQTIWKVDCCVECSICIRNGHLFKEIFLIGDCTHLECNVNAEANNLFICADWKVDCNILCFCKACICKCDIQCLERNLVAGICAVFIGEYHCPDEVKHLFCQRQIEAFDVQDTAVCDDFAVVKDCFDKADNVNDRFIIACCCWNCLENFAIANLCFNIFCQCLCFCIVCISCKSLLDFVNKHIKEVCDNCIEVYVGNHEIACAHKTWKVDEQGFLCAWIDNCATDCAVVVYKLNQNIGFAVVKCVDLSLDVHLECIFHCAQADRHCPERAICGEETAEKPFKKCAKCRRNATEWQFLLCGVDCEAKSEIECEQWIFLKVVDINTLALQDVCNININILVERKLVDMYTKVNFFKILAIGRILSVMLEVKANAHIKAVKLAICADFCNKVNGCTFQVFKLVEVKASHIIDKWIDFLDVDSKAKLLHEVGEHTNDRRNDWHDQWQVTGNDNTLSAVFKRNDLCARLCKDQAFQHWFHCSERNVDGQCAFGDKSANVKLKDCIVDNFCDCLSARNSLIDLCKAGEDFGQVNILCSHNIFALANAVLTFEAGDVHDDCFTCIVQAQEQCLFVSTQGLLEHFDQELWAVNIVWDICVNWASKSEAIVVSVFVLAVFKAKIHIKVDNTASGMYSKGSILQCFPSHVRRNSGRVVHDGIVISGGNGNRIFRGRIHNTLTCKHASHQADEQNDK